MATNLGLLPDLQQLRLAPSQLIGSLVLENPGDADAYPVWEVRGPGNGFRAVSPSGEALAWNGTLAADESVTINTETGTVVDHLGRNRYADLAPAPRMWSVPPGVTSAAVQWLDTSAGSRITVSWRPRRWLVI
jgi:hypothetical protein